jgi:hypothetical protein
MEAISAKRILDQARNGVRPYITGLHKPSIVHGRRTSPRGRLHNLKYQTLGAVHHSIVIKEATRHRSCLILRHKIQALSPRHNATGRHAPITV